MHKYAAVALLALLSALPAKANTVTVTASMTVGVQSFNAGFDWDVTGNRMVQGTDYISAQGPLGEFFLTATLPHAYPGLPLVNWQNAAGDFFQIDDDNTGGWHFGKFPTLGSYGANNLDLWCASRGGACHDLGWSGAYFGGYYGGSLTVSESSQLTSLNVVPTPEPSTLLMLLPALGFLIWKRLK